MTPQERAPGGWRLWVPTGLLVLLFLAEGVTKLLAMDNQTEAWERWGYPMWTLFLVGGMETIGALALLSRRSAFYAAVALLALMPGGAFTHIRNGEWLMLGLPVAAGMMLAVVLWQRRPSWLEARLGRRRVAPES